MFRLTTFFSLTLAGIVSANAAQIQIGQISGNVNEGLTASYIGGCAGINGAMFACTGTDSLTNAGSFFSEKAYIGTLFGSPTLTTAPTMGFPSGGSITDKNAAVSGTNAGSNGVTFAMIDDTTANTNYWSAQGNGDGSSGTITIPVEVYNTDAAWTMINNQWGVNGSTNTIVKFIFGSTATGTDEGSLTFNLINGVQVRDAVECAAKSGTGTTDCTTFATATSSSNTSAAYSSNYTAGKLGAFAGTSGSVALDDQLFNFGGMGLGEYLTEIQITDENGGGQLSRTGVSAVTVDVAPEPGTILLIVTGLGALGLGRFRKKL